MKRKLFLTALCILPLAGAFAQEPTARLSLDSCRALAVRSNKELRMADMKRRAARLERQAAFTHYLPRVSAAGGYLRTSRELSLLSDAQKDVLGSPGLLGGSLVDALRTDTRDMGAAAVVLTQPVYMGGKIAAYHRVTRYAEQVARREGDLALQEVVVAVDEAYWRIVALEARKRLAESYLALTRRLDDDLRRMADEGVATKADRLSVRVKVNEAEVALIQADNGLALSRMELCRLCGLPMDTPVSPADEEADVPSVPLRATEADVEAAFARRPELHALDLSVRIQEEKVRLARAGYLPAVALAGGYAATNPSVFNSFERRFKGMWGVGVTVSVPLLTCGERVYKVKAARAEAVRARYRWEESREKVELQVNQSRRKVEEAAERLRAAERSREEADENLRTATLGLKEGVIPVSDVLEAQTAWLSARSTCVAARVDLRLADLYLRKATGSLGVRP